MTNDDVFETTDGAGATLRLQPIHDTAVITVSDETTAAIALSYEQARALANALIDAGF
jgi:hypothetical protein